MTGFGFAEILVLALVSGGLDANDLASLVEPSHYFKSRQIEPTVDRLIDIIIAEPKTPRQQILQLTALRHIADQAEIFKKAKNYATNRLAIEDIAQGERGQDPEGFAREYAKRILDKLDGKKSPAEKIRPLREEVLDWFPADVKFAYALDARCSQDAPRDLLKDMLKLMPEDAKREMYAQLEKLGNIRVERIAFGLAGSDKQNDRKFFVRFTGKGNHAWLSSALVTASGGFLEAKKLKEADGTGITMLHSNQNPLLMLIGNTDLMIVGYSSFDGDNQKLAKEALELRAKKKPHAGNGALKDQLAKIPERAVALMVGEVPVELGEEFNFLLDPMPSRISAHVERTPMGLEVKAEAVLANAEEAGKFLKKLVVLRKQGIASLQEAIKNPLPERPTLPYQVLIDLVESVQADNQAERVQMRAFVPHRSIQELLKRPEP